MLGLKDILTFFMSFLFGPQKGCPPRWWTGLDQYSWFKESQGKIPLDNIPADIIPWGFAPKAKLYISPKDNIPMDNTGGVNGWDVLFYHGPLIPSFH